MIVLVRWYGVSKLDDASWGENLAEEEALEDNYDHEEGVDDEYTTERDAEMQAPNTGSTLPFPDASQLSFDASQHSMQDIFQQALNSAWWLGYWTALHQQKVSLSLTFVTSTN